MPHWHKLGMPASPLGLVCLLCVPAQQHYPVSWEKCQADASKPGNILVLLCQDTYQANASALVQKLSLWWCVGMDAQLMPVCQGGSQHPHYFQWVRRHTSVHPLGQYELQPLPVCQDTYWPYASGWHTCLAKFPASISGPDGSQPPGYFQWIRRHTSGILLGWYELNSGQFQLAGGSEGTPVGFYWASISSGQFLSAGPNAWLMTVSWDTYQPYARGLGQMPILWWLIGMDTQLMLLNVTGLDDGLVFWHLLANA
ncbi:hypothetical protein F5J12DRAFT_780504 [Pisolithus orientalis]|uniref:uncharacterized protein n=1 Tax=Pisolithus orientalis TaxID=936130 RepID=UPI0022258CC9|nr:uncharacterized protein F5J12DRAFT_780504 [Pisolithus orientalis]KAI6025665.1 hypothetical protein F5J12DRAFT_780504 [Pisolithus orientalis]